MQVPGICPDCRSQLGIPWLCLGGTGCPEVLRAWADQSGGGTAAPGEAHIHYRCTACGSVLTAPVSVYRAGRISLSGAD